MTLGWYLAVSVLIFCIGAGGVLVRRNPLVVLLCLELMLNAANLALVTFARMHGGEAGQIFALIVMVVAACEVTVGLGLAGRDQPPQPAHRCRRTARVERMSPTTWGWLVLLFPLLGTIVIGLGFRRYSRIAGVIGTGAIALSFVCAVGALLSLLGRSGGHREVVSSLWNYASSAGVDAKLQILVDPISVFMILVVTGVSTLIHLYSTAYMRSDAGYSRYFAYLNFFVLSMLILVLGGNFVMLIVGWAFVGAASYMLISFWYRRTHGDQRRHQGVRDQRGRRRRARARHLLHLPPHAHGLVPGHLQGRAARLPHRLDRPRRRLPPVPRRRVRQVGPGAAAHMAPRRDGGSDAGLLADPRGDDGDRRRLPDRAPAPAVPARTERR